MHTVQHRAKIVFSVLTVIVLTSALFSAYYIYNHPHLKELNYVLSQTTDEAWDTVFGTDFESNPTSVSDTEYVESDVYTYEEEVVQEPAQQQPQSAPVQQVYKQPAPAKECYKYTVPHLDGSSSTLCYSQGDYNQLVSLGYNYSSAKTFYEFHLDGVQDYQAQYEQTGSNIYLDAKASQQRQADQEKQKMDSSIGSMQEIEKRGY